MPGSRVSVSIGPPEQAFTQLQDYAGGSNLTYLGTAKSTQQTFVFTVTSVSKAAAAVVTITAHGLNTDNRVTISGASGSWAALNGVQIVTRTGANTFTIPVDTSAYSSTFDGAISTTAPRTSAACWSIQKFYYSGSSVVRTAFAAGTSAENQIWDNIATLAFE